MVAVKHCSPSEITHDEVDNALSAQSARATLVNATGSMRSATRLAVSGGLHRHHEGHLVLGATAALALKIGRAHV